MIVLDNSVLSAFIRLDLMSELRDLKSEINITPSIDGLIIIPSYYPSEDTWMNDWKTRRRI